MGLVEAYEGRGVSKLSCMGKPQRGGSSSLEMPWKDFNLAIGGGLGWVQ